MRHIGLAKVRLSRRGLRDEGRCLSFPPLKHARPETEISPQITKRVPHKSPPAQGPDALRKQDNYNNAPPAPGELRQTYYGVGLEGRSHRGEEREKRKNKVSQHERQGNLLAHPVIQNLSSVLGGGGGGPPCPVIHSGFASRRQQTWDLQSSVPWAVSPNLAASPRCLPLANFPLSFCTYSRCFVSPCFSFVWAPWWPAMDGGCNSTGQRRYFTWQITLHPDKLHPC